MNPLLIKERTLVDEVNGCYYSRCYFKANTLTIQKPNHSKTNPKKVQILNESRFQRDGFRISTVFNIY